MSLSDQRLVKETNKSSLSQTERFVFSIDKSHEQWLGKYLRQRSSPDFQISREDRAKLP
jgi:hypothetical protein